MGGSCARQLISGHKPALFKLPPCQAFLTAQFPIMKKNLFYLAFAALFMAGCETRTEKTETTVIEQETLVTDSVIVSTELNSAVAEIEAASENVDSLLNEI